MQFYCINTTAAGIAATAGFTEICYQSSEALTDSQPGGERVFSFNFKCSFQYHLYTNVYLVCNRTQTQVDQSNGPS